MSFQIALSGLNAASTDLRVTSNNIANANTTAFKASRAEFADVFTGDAVGIGAGARLSDVRQDFNQGNVEITARQLDLAINGNGFFALRDTGGGNLYSRVGAFGLSADGYVENSEGERLLAYRPLSDGQFNVGDPQPLRIVTETAPPVASTLVDMSVNLPAGATNPAIPTFDPADPETYTQSTSTVAFDSTGQGHTVSYYFVRNGTSWNVGMTYDGAQVGGTGNAGLQPVTFTNSGRIATPANGIVSFGAVTPAGADPQTLNLDLSRTTQFGGDFVVNNINPDGQASGRLRNVEIDQTGIVFARFSNGQSSSIGKVALADFSNPEGLLKVSNTSFQETFSSGEATPGQAAESTFGLIQSGALETSNVDITEQLVRTITAQRLFQANAQVISALDEVTQTIINLR
jgi:flagellar hook protein FlgE